MINEEFKNVEQQINYRNSWDEKRYSKESKNQGDINIGTAIRVLFFLLIYWKGLTLYLSQESSIPLILESEY